MALEMCCRLDKPIVRFFVQCNGSRKSDPEVLPISCFIDVDAFGHVSISQENFETWAFQADRVGDGAASADDDVDKHDFLDNNSVDLVGGSAALVMHGTVHESMFPQVCTSDDVVLDGSCVGIWPPLLATVSMSSWILPRWEILSMGVNALMQCMTTVDMTKKTILGWMLS